MLELTLKGRSIRLRTVWIVESSDPRPRFVTAYRRKETMDTPDELDVVVLRVDFRDEMAGAGFADVEIRSVHHTIHVPAVSAFWLANVRNSAPLSLLRKNLDADQWAELGANVVKSPRTRIRSRADRIYVAGTHWCRYTAGIATGRRGCGIGMSCT